MAIILFCWGFSRISFFDGVFERREQLDLSKRPPSSVPWCHLVHIYPPATPYQVVSWATRWYQPGCLTWLALYRGVTVVVHKVDKTELSLTRNDLIELVNVSHSLHPPACLQLVGENSVCKHNYLSLVCIKQAPRSLYWKKTFCGLKFSFKICIANWSQIVSYSGMATIDSPYELSNGLSIDDTGHFIFWHSPKIARLQPRRLVANFFSSCYFSYRLDIGLV